MAPLAMDSSPPSWAEAVFDVIDLITALRLPTISALLLHDITILCVRKGACGAESHRCAATASRAALLRGAISDGRWEVRA